MRTKTIKFIVLGLMLLSALPNLVVGQATKEQKMLIDAELTKRGLTEAEAKEALKGIGLDPATLTPEIIVSRQNDINAALDGAVAKKNVVSSVDSMQITKPLPDNKSTPAEKVVEAAVQNAVKETASTSNVTDIYGHSVFTDQSLEVFRTTDGAKAPDTYILGAGDIIRVTIFGVSQADLVFEINQQGYVQPTGLPQIYLQGVSLGDARQLLKQRFSSAYRFQSDQFVLTIQTARTIQVQVFGETKLRGSFTISALNSPFGALMAAGGPNEIGSVRNIELIRGKKRIKLDVYEFLRNPAIAKELDLQQNDLIYVPVARSVVRIEGGVKRPMRYELSGREGLKELVELAGGLQFYANTELVQIERQLSDTTSLLEYPLTDVMKGQLKVVLFEGDVVRVRQNNKQLEAFVEIEGEVFYPGKYALIDGLSLPELIQKAQIKAEAKTEFVIIERLFRDGTTKVLKLQGAEVDTFSLLPRDKALLFSKKQFTNQATVTVSGSVKLPFDRQLEFGDELSVENAILVAGGLLPTADPIAFVTRTDLFNTNIKSYIQVDLLKNQDFKLRAGDVLTVYDRTLFSLAKGIKLTGAVNLPSSFTYNPNLKLSDLFKMAGGFTIKTDKNRVDVFRLYYDNIKGTGYERIVLEVDSAYNIIGKDFRLAPFDIVVVRDLPLFDLDRTVQLSGQVLYAGTYPLEASRIHLSHILKKAGGLNVLADTENGIIIRTSGTRKQIGFNPRKALANEGNRKHDPILLPGDVIEIQTLQNTVGIRLRATREADLLNAGVAVGNTSENDLRFFTYRGNRTARWYVRNLAGGFAEKANKNSVTVIYPDGSVRGTRTYFGVIRDYPNLRPGGIISLTYKIEKPKGEKKEVNIDAVYTRTLTSLTSIMTILILARQLQP